MTSNTTVVPLRQPGTIDDPLTAILRSGGRVPERGVGAVLLGGLSRDVRPPRQAG